VEEYAVHVFVVGVVVAMMVVAMIMSMTVSVIMTMTMIMSDMRMSKREQTHEIDRKAQGTHHQQFRDAAELAFLRNPLGGFPDEFHADEHEENTIAKPGERVEFIPSIRFLGGSGPFRGHGGTEADDETETVEEHVDCVREQAQRAREVAINALDEHEGKVEAVKGWC
jgi:hypothetical protein